jgi:hypothetical protein
MNNRDAVALAAQVQPAQMRGSIEVAGYLTPVRCILLIMLAIHTCLLAWSAYRHSPVLSEVGHLPAGISHWHFGRFDLYRVNPPLVRMTAAIPVMLSTPVTDWRHYSDNPLSRSETIVGIDFVNANGRRTCWFYTLGRWASIPYCWIGAIVCYCWSRDLYGIPAGVVSTALWCHCPSVLGNGSLIMPDIPAAALGVAANYSFWKALVHPTWYRAAVAGIVLGIAALTKTTIAVFVALWPALWLFYCCTARPRLSLTEWRRRCTMLLTTLCISVYTLNVGYCFEGSFTRLGSYTFASELLNGSTTEAPHAFGNRFANTVWSGLPLPFPQHYVQGIDTQWVDFESGMRSYLDGQWSPRGWWYFYIYALALKLPLGVLGLLLLAIRHTVIRRLGAVTWRDEMLVLVPLATILVLVSSQTGFSIHLRYVLPALPFGYIWIGKVTQSCTGRDRISKWLTALAVAWTVSGSLWTYPHSLSYFNELAGGPKGGPDHLLVSSSAWDQDLLFLKEWCDRNPTARPLYVASSGSINAHIIGIQGSDLLRQPIEAGKTKVQRVTAPGRPGWYAIDVTYLHDIGIALGYPAGTDAFVAEEPIDPSVFLTSEPIARIGYTIHIYHNMRDTGSPVRKTRAAGGDTPHE